jgi:hypothetical protein
MHDSIHAKSGQDLPLKLQYIRTEKEAVMGWVWLGCLSAGRPTHTAVYADHSTLRNVHCCVPRAAEECSYQCSKCRCAVGEEGRRETVLEDAPIF